MKKTVVLLVAVAMILATSLTAVAGGSQMRSALDDAWTGGLLGALVGGAILVFREDPEDHLDYIAYGFGAGVIAGAVYGMARSTSALAQMDEGKIRFNLPEPKAQIVAAGDKKALQLSADLLRVNF